MSNEPLTEAVGDTQQALQVYAWSEVEEDPEPTRKRRWPVIVVAGLVAVVLTVAVGHRMTHVLTPGAPTGPNVVTAQPAPPPPSPPPKLAALDDQFIADTINHNAPQTDTPKALYNAREVCKLLTEGHSRSEIEVPLREAVTGYSSVQASIFVALSVKYYCPEFGG